MKKKKILFLVNTPSPYRIKFFNELGKLCDLTVLFEQRSSIRRDSTWYSKNYTGFKAVFLKGVKIKKDTILSIDVSNYLKKNKYDIFIVGGYSTPTGMLAIELLNFRKIPFILNVDGGIIKKDSNYKYKIKKRYISSATYWLSTGEYTSKYLMHYGAQKERIFNYPFTSVYEKDILNDLVSYEEKEKMKSELKISGSKMILAIGRFIYSKGFDVLLKASENLPKEYEVYIIGGQPTDEYLNLIKKYKLDNVHFINFKSEKDLKKYYMASDLFVLPTRGDVWGLVINEAMAMGLPIITTDQCIAGLELIENNKNGFIVPVEDESILNNKIKTILNDANKRKIMSINNINKIKNYSIENMAIEHIRIFEKYLKEQAHEIY